MKVGRNDPCPCGSGKKYKHCCYAKDSVKHDEPLLAAGPEEEPADGEAEETSASGTEGGARERDHDRSGGRSRFHGGGPRGRGGPSSPRVFRGAQRGN